MNTPIELEFLTAFRAFINGELNHADFIEKLESIASATPNDIIYFRFFQDDPALTSIREIDSALKGYVNREYIRECLAAACANPRYFKVE